MPWVWSDELASAAEAAGVFAGEMDAWRTHPVAFKRPADTDLVRMARLLLAMPVEEGQGSSDAQEVPATGDCSCGKALLVPTGRPPNEP